MSNPLLSTPLSLQVGSEGADSSRGGIIFLPCTSPVPAESSSGGAEYSKCRNVILNQTCFTLTRNMATGGYHVRPKVTEENFSCPVCLEVLENPISIPCGHT